MNYTDKIDETDNNYIIRTYDNGMITRFVNDLTPSVIPPPTPQPTNQEISDNVIACMSGIFDLYMK